MRTLWDNSPSFDMAEFKVLLETDSVATALEETQDLIVEKLHEAGCFVEMDEAGNIYATKGKGNYVCLVSSYDELSLNDAYSDWVEAIQYGDTIHGLTARKGRVGSLGLHSKAGTYACMLAAQDLDNIKILLFTNTYDEDKVVNEGVKNCDVTFFNNCNLVIQLQGEGRNIAVDATKEFEEALEPKLKQYGFQVAEANGQESLYSILKKEVKCPTLCISCGLSSIMTDSESISISSYLKAIHLTYSIIRDLGDGYWGEQDMGLSCKEIQDRLKFMRTFQRVLYKFQHYYELTEEEFTELVNLRKLARTDPKTWYNKLLYKDFTPVFTRDEKEYPEFFATKYKGATWYSIEDVDYFETYFDYANWFKGDTDVAMDDLSILVYNAIQAGHISIVIETIEELVNKGFHETALTLLEDAVNQAPYNKELLDYQASVHEKGL